MSVCPTTVNNMALPCLDDLLAAHAAVQNDKFYECNGKLKVLLNGKTQNGAVELRVVFHGRMADCMRSPLYTRAFSEPYLACFRGWEAGMDGAF